MSNIWEVCKFSDEIVSGHLELHKFAVELHDVISGKADPVYQDPAIFFDNTYLTTQMRSVLRDVLMRTERSIGKPVTVIDTGFGGGKTHTLTLLYHIFSNPDLGFEYAKKYGIDGELGIESISDVRVVAIDGRDVKKNTLWGEIADKLGKYESVQQYDKSPKPIHDLDIIKAFFDRPTLLMIDELPHYLSTTLAERIGDTTKSKLTEDFLYALISSVSSSKNSVFIMTLTEKQQLYRKTVDRIKSTIAETDTVIEGLKQTLSRQTNIINPVTKDEIYDVIRQRLIREINEDEKKNTVQEYLDYYTDQGLITDPKFQDRLEKSYPLHPELIDMLYERVSTISKFNQTRGTLRLLALVLNDIYANRRNCQLVSVGDINFESAPIVDEITAKIDRNEFKKIIDTDCIEHARELDRTKNIKIVEQVGKTIYLHSLHETPNKKSGITSNQIKLVVGRPGIDSSLVEKALLDDVRKYFWYIKESNGQFYFVDAVNENAIIAEYAKNITSQEIDEQVRAELVTLSRGIFKPIVWTDDIEDGQKLKLYLFHYRAGNDIKTKIVHMLGYARDNSARRYQNTIVFVYADAGRVYLIEKYARELVAIKKSKKDERIKADKTFLQNITQKEEQSKGNLSNACLTSYNHIGYPNGPEPRLDVMSHADMTSNTIGEMASEFLSKKGKMIPEIGRDAIIVESCKKVEDIYNEFLYDKRKKFLQDMTSVKQAVSDGVNEGLFGYASELEKLDEGYVGEISKKVDVEFSGYVIHKDHVRSNSKLEPTNGSGLQETGDPGNREDQHQYKIPLNTIDSTLGILDILIIGDFANMQKNMNVKAQLVGNTEVSLSSKLGDVNAVKNMIKSFKSYSEGTFGGHLELRSADDISEKLEKHDLVFE